MKSVQQQYSYPNTQNVVNINKKLEKPVKNESSNQSCCNL